jgi:hypothetical protein
MKTLDKNNTKCYNIVGDAMEIDIHVTPYSQSAKLQLAVNGIYDLYKDYWAYDDTLKTPYILWKNDVILEITENNFLPQSGKQKMFLRSKIKPERNSNEIDFEITLPIYPLYSNTEYQLTVTLHLTQSDGVQTDDFVQSVNFRTKNPGTAGKQSEKNIELTQREKELNATYLYNKLVRANNYTLESFSCLLGMSDCAGNLNPAQYMMYKQFEYPTGDSYNYYRYDTNSGNWNYFGIYNTEWIPWPPFGGTDQQLYIPQSGKNDIPYFYRGSPYFFIYGGEYRYYFYDSVYYNTVPQNVGRSTTKILPQDFKKSMAFGMFPLSHETTLRMLTGQKNPTTSDINKLICSDDLISIENFVKLYRVFSQTNSVGIYNLTTAHKQQFSSLWQSYPTPARFSKCRNRNIEKIAEFYYYCMIDGLEGTFGYTTIYNDPQTSIDPYPIYPLYSLECVKKKSRYWYNYFKKDRPWWPYFRWTI